MMQVASRIALNAATLFEHTHGNNGSHSGHAGAHKTPAPCARVFDLGGPVKINMASAVREYVMGTALELRKMQWTVRGHWRNQAHGQARAQRKLKWIEPHWARREGATDRDPINLREHAVG
jgi:hypothetical protein